ncbi:hypothetical protein ABKN59_007903 [Abortiporus biennis]
MRVYVAFVMAVSSDGSSALHDCDASLHYPIFCVANDWNSSIHPPFGFLARRIWVRLRNMSCIELLGASSQDHALKLVRKEEIP